MDNFGGTAHKVYYVKLGGRSLFFRCGPEPSGIGSVCLLLGEFSSPNPEYSILDFALLVA